MTVFVNGTLDLLDISCKQHHWTALNPFLNSTKNGDNDGTCKRSIRPLLSSKGVNGRERRVALLEKRN